uniref:DNA 3'-5' helicase n=1 Tax=viral metagenome TaxID=1070528 RepID=A0A6C0BM58_9ZZZZ
MQTPFVWSGPPAEAGAVEPSRLGEQEAETFDSIVHAIEKKRNFPLSPEQRDICRFVHEHRENVLIDSVAGSGKTSTLLMCLWFIAPSAKVLLLSFNKTVQTTLDREVRRASMQMATGLGREMPACSTFTCHSHGLTALRRAFGTQNTVADNKYQAITTAISQDTSRGVEANLKKWKWHMQAMLKLLMNLAVDCTPSTAWSEDFVVAAGERYGIPMPQVNGSSYGRAAKREEETFDDYMRVLYQAYRICCERRSNFDFTDMVYLPVRLGLPLIQYDVVLIDESQDLNAVQIELIARSVEPEGGRVIFVGDKNQAIYGFRGADTHAIETVTRHFQARQFPLHTCWRCPKKVIAAAQDIVPHIRARPGAVAGITEKYAYENAIFKKMRQRSRQHSHLVLCRTNAPLIQLAVELVVEQVECYVSADALRDAMLKLLEQITNAHWIKVRALKERMDRYRTWKKAHLEELGEQLIEKNDQLDSLQTLIKSMRNPTVLGVREKIEALFSPSSAVTAGHPGDVVRLSTIHQCKGQEEDVIYVIKPSLLPHPASKSGWELEQEDHLKYVAITRAKRELHWFCDE